MAKMRFLMFIAAALLSTAAAPLRATAARGDFSKADTVRIVLSNFQFTPATLHLRSGEPVTMIFTTTSSGGHDFTAAQFFAAATIRPGDVQYVRNGTVRVGAGQDVVIALVPATGRYPVKCSHAFHKMLGMSGSIVVNW